MKGLLCDLFHATHKTCSALSMETDTFHHLELKSKKPVLQGRAIDQTSYYASAESQKCHNENANSLENYKEKPISCCTHLLSSVGNIKTGA